MSSDDGHVDPYDMLDHINDIASALSSRNTDLDWLWYDIRNNIIDVVTRTIALGLFASIAAALLYIVISRKRKSGVSVLILISVIPDCLTAFGVWLVMLSRLRQSYAMAHANIIDTRTMVAGIPACIHNHQCDDSYFLEYTKPEYMGHGCVGTALAVGDPMMHAAVVCVATAVFLLDKNRLGAVTGSLLFTPLLAAVGSAAIHVKRVCSPETDVDGVDLDSVWEVFDPQEADVTTARLSQLTFVVPLLLVISHLWETRDVLKQYLSDGASCRRWTYWLAVTYILPACVNEGWQSLRSAYDSDELYASVLQYTFFSAGDALLVPLMAMYPGLALLVQKFWDSDAEDEDTPVKEKADAPASATSPTPVDTKSDETAHLTA